MSEVPAAVEIYHRIIDCRELDHISGGPSSSTNHNGYDLLQRDVLVTHRTSHTHPSSQTDSTAIQQPQVKLELGHHATLRLKPTFEGYTHDWEVFLRSPEGASNCQIHHFVKRVEFHLHQSFSRQKIVQKEPPFKLNESGYAGFLFPIDVYFRNPGYPKKIRFLYDLTLDRRRSTIHIRCEKLTFRNPPDHFRSLLIKGGGQLVRRRHHHLNDSGLVGSTFSRILDVKPSLQSSGIEPDLSSNEQIVDSKDWFKVKQEVPETPRQLNQDKENQPQPGSVIQSKTSISFLQDWLRNIRSTKLANKRQGSLEIGFDPCGGGAVTSAELERASFSSGIFSADSWISEGRKGPRGSGPGASDSWISEGRRVTGGGLSGSDSCVSYRRVARSGIGDGFGGKGRGGERRGLREMKQVSGNWNSLPAVSSLTRPFTIKLQRADMRNETSSSHVMQPSLVTRKGSSSRRGRPPKKHVSATVSGPPSSSYTHPPPPPEIPPPPEEQTSTTTTSKTFKTKADVLNSIIRRRLLKVKDHVVQTPVQPQPHRPLGHYTSVAGIRLKLTHSLMPQTLKKSPIESEVVSPVVPVQRRGRGRPRKNPLLPPPEKPDPGKRKRGRPPRAVPGVRTRNSGNSFGNHQASDMGNSKRPVQTAGAPKTSSSDDDVVFVGYSPPKQEPQNDADYGIPPQVSVGARTTKSMGHARQPRSVGRPRKIGRKRSTQLELLKSATEEFVGGSGLQAEEERVRSETSSGLTAGRPRGKRKRKIGGASQQRASNFAVRLPSPQQEREDDDWMDRNPRRKKLRIVPVRCGSDNEDVDEDTGVSDLSVDYPSDILRQSSNLPRSSSNFVNELEKKAGRGSRGNVLKNPKKSGHTWMTSTPMKPKPPPRPPVRQRSVAGQTAKKRRNKDDVAWSRYGKNTKQPAKRGRPRKVPPPVASSTNRKSTDDLESADPLVPCNNNPTPSPEVATASGESVSVLMELQQRLATLADGQLLKRVVQIVEESGLYQLDDAMFDFDLCNLDRPTIEKLKVCLR